MGDGAVSAVSNSHKLKSVHSRVVGVRVRRDENKRSAEGAPRVVTTGCSERCAERWKDAAMLKVIAFAGAGEERSRREELIIVMMYSYICISSARAPESEI